jgi:glutathione synthase/RimK-type ligase-like ATP-grasp enzyme
MKPIAFIIPNEMGESNLWYQAELTKYANVDIIKTVHDLQDENYEFGILRLYSEHGATIGDHFDTHPCIKAAQTLLNLNIPVLNGPVLQNIVEDKLVCGHILALSGLPVLAGWDYFHAEGQKENTAGWIVKPNRGERARDISFVKTLDEAIDLAKAAPEQMIIQHFLSNAICVRIVCSLDKIYASYAKEMLDKSHHVAAITLGGKRVPWDPKRAGVGELALKATQAAGASLLGVDILVSEDDEPYLLELNANPGGLPHLPLEAQKELIKDLVEQGKAAN